MRLDPDRHLPDPGIDDSPTDAELASAADGVDVTRWVLDLFNHCVTTSDYARWAQDCYREIMDAVERGRG
jgi:hypothetical protein